MDFKNATKKILVFGLFLGIVGVLLPRAIDEWTPDRIKSILSKLNLFTAEVGINLSPEEDSGLDFSEINFKNLLPNGKETTLGIDKEEKSADESQEATVAPEPKLTLIEIEEKVNEIKEKTGRISQKIDKLSALVEIKKEIGVIAEKTDTIEKEVNGLRVLAQIQGKINKIAEKTELLNQDITELV